MILFGVTMFAVLVMLLLGASWKYILCFLFNMVILTIIDKLIGIAVRPKKEDKHEDTN